VFVVALEEQGADVDAVGYEIVADYYVQWDRKI
jgi:hypothetical protein